MQPNFKKLIRMITKKLSLLIACSSLTAVVTGQTTFGVKGGVNPSRWNVEVGGEKEDDYKNRVGFHVGAVVDFAISQSFSIQPQLLFVNKGSKERHGDHDDKILVNAIDLPINFLYKAKAGKGKIFAGGGPNLGFNLGGKVKGEHDGVMEEDKLEIGSNAGQLRAFDFGLNALAGYELGNGLFVSANYTPGLRNLDNRNGIIARSSYFGLSVGYFFHKKGSKTAGN